MTAPLSSIIVGAGLMGRWHAEYATRAGGHVVAVVDENFTRASALAAKYGAQAYQSNDAGWLDRAASGVAHVCTPAATHVPVVLSALDAGAHVVCEKPLAANVADTTELLDRAESCGRALVGVHQFPFQVGFNHAVRRLSELGRLSQVRFTAYTAGADGVVGVNRRHILEEILPHPISLFARLGFDLDLCWDLQVCGDDTLEMAATVDRTRLVIDLSTTARPPVNELRLIGSEATSVVDLYHGYSYQERGRGGRSGKLLAPFVQGSRRIAAASVNLARRSLDREPAFPGLLRLLRLTYGALSAGEIPSLERRELLASARIIESVRAA